MALHAWAVPQLSNLLSVDESSAREVVTYTEKLSPQETSEHLQNLLGDSPQALEFITSFNTMKAIPGTTSTLQPTPKSKNPFLNGSVNGGSDDKNGLLVEKGDSNAGMDGGEAGASKVPVRNGASGITGLVGDAKSTSPASASADPPGYDAHSGSLKKVAPFRDAAVVAASPAQGYAPPPGSPPAPMQSHRPSPAAHRPHSNAVIEAARVRARDEQEFQNLLQNVQFKYGIYNSDIEPEHDTDYYCNCAICNYQRVKWNRVPVQTMWAKAVMYPGEKAYNDDFRTTMFFSSNPYRYRVVSPYGVSNGRWFQQTPQPKYHAMNVRQTIQLNAQLNAEAQQNINAREPKTSIWQLDEEPDSKQPSTSTVNRGEKKQAPMEKQAPPEKDSSGDYPNEKASAGKRRSIFGSSSSNGAETAAAATSKPSKLTGLMKAMRVSTSEEKEAAKLGKVARQQSELRDAVLTEENGRWPDAGWRYLVAVYQEKIGMSSKVADLRARQPLQYLHLLRAGYFEPIPVAWANQASNPLKFSIEASVGWRGITPAWRGYEDTAEERLYWVLNHREGSVGMRMKPDFISEMNMARERMARAVEPPPEYFSANDTCHLQHTSEGYSKQVMPPPFRAFDRPELPTDDTMILLDVSGSMDFDPVRPIYDQYMITAYTPTTQPKNKDVAKAIIRRFTDALANHDHTFSGYDLTTFSSQAHYIGTVNHQNLDAMWRRVRIGGGTRVMTGWQKVKDLHFQKHSESATHHPVYGWQAGPATPMLRLLLLLDGEATDMDEFELDLLGLSWAHVTIFLIGVDGCPHHHRHANELQRISDVNHHVSFVDAQGNTPERFVTHELLKRHLGYDVSMAEFQQLEELPAYS